MIAPEALAALYEVGQATFNPREHASVTASLVAAEFHNDCLEYSRCNLCLSELNGKTPFRNGKALAGACFLPSLVRSSVRLSFFPALS